MPRRWKAGSTPRPKGKGSVVNNGTRVKLEARPEIETTKKPNKFAEAFNNTKKWFGEQVSNVRAGQETRRRRNSTSNSRPNVNFINPNKTRGAKFRNTIKGVKKRFADIAEKISINAADFGAGNSTARSTDSYRGRPSHFNTGHNFGVFRRRVSEGFSNIADRLGSGGGLRGRSYADSRHSGTNTSKQNPFKPTPQQMVEQQQAQANKNYSQNPQYAAPSHIPSKTSGQEYLDTVQQQRNKNYDEGVKSGYNNQHSNQDTKPIDNTAPPAEIAQDSLDNVNKVIGQRKRNMQKRSKGKKDEGFGDGLKEWWNKKDTNEKWAWGVGGGVGALVVGNLAFGGGRRRDY